MLTKGSCSQEVGFGKQPSWSGGSAPWSVQDGGGSDDHEPELKWEPLRYFDFARRGAYISTWRGRGGQFLMQPGADQDAQRGLHTHRQILETH